MLDTKGVSEANIPQATKIMPRKQYTKASFCAATIVRPSIAPVGQRHPCTKEGQSTIHNHQSPPMINPPHGAKMRALLKGGTTARSNHNKGKIMKIDDNEIELKALECFGKGENKAAHELQKEFLNAIKTSCKDSCSCPEKCRYHGKCWECVMIHRGHGDHLPFCFWSMVKRKIDPLATLAGHRVEEA